MYKNRNIVFSSQISCKIKLLLNWPVFLFITVHNLMLLQIRNSFKHFATNFTGQLTRRPRPHRFIAVVVLGGGGGGIVWRNTAMVMRTGQDDARRTVQT